MGELTTIYIPSNEVEAQMIKALLEAENIRVLAEPAISSYAMEGYVPGNMDGTWGKLLVRTADLARAQIVLEGYLGSLNEP